MPPKLGKNEGNINGYRSSKKQITNRLNDITERTQRTILEKFTDEQLSEFRELFNMFDKDNQEQLTPQTLISIMKAVDQIPTESDMIDLMREIDIDNSGTIDFYEFVNIISNNMYPNETNQEIRQAFNLFDYNQDGIITFNDLKIINEKYLKNLINDFELHQMIDLANTNNNQEYVSYEDFLHVAVCRNDKKQNNINT